MNNITPELVERAKAAKSAEELFELARASGLDITEEMAKSYFRQLNRNGELDDDDLDAVAGGFYCFGSTLSNLFDQFTPSNTTNKYL